MMEVVPRQPAVLQVLLLYKYPKHKLSIESASIQNLDIR